MCSAHLPPSSTLTLDAKTAGDLMTPHVVSIPMKAPLHDAVGILRDKRISAAPVVDDFDNAVGVLSRSDIVAHDADQLEYLQPDAKTYAKKGFVVRLRQGVSHVLHGDRTPALRAKDLMTPVIFSVARDTPATTVIEAMLSLAVHRVFVTESDGKVIGVVSTTDVIRHLQPLHSSEKSLDEKSEAGICMQPV